MKVTLRGTSTSTATTAPEQPGTRPAGAATHSLTRSKLMFTSYKNLLGPRGFAPDAEVTGVLGDVMMNSKATDLLLTILIGGIIWLLASAAGFR
jgi:hypothetical protein